MYFFNTLTFCIIVASGIIAYFLAARFLQTKFSNFNPYLILLPLNLFWIYWFFHVSPTLLLGLLVFCVAFFFLATNAKKITLWLPLTIVVAFWAFGRLPTFVHVFKSERLMHFHEFLYAMIGLSYTACRLWSFAVGCKNGSIVRPKLANFLLQIFFFPTLLSGPITRYENFSAKNERSTVGSYLSEYFIPGIKRILVGMVKKNFIALLMVDFALPNINIYEFSHTRILLGAYAYCFYLYLDFSGYTDMAVGLSKLLKIAVPENFNYPFYARNPQDFWSRWHISLCRWLYEFVFAPVYTLLLRITRGHGRIVLAGAAIFLTFAFSGIWHGEDGRFIREGFYHATALFIFVTFDGTLKQYYPHVRKYMQKSPWVTAISRFFTFHYIVISFMIFSLDLTSLKEVGRKLLGL